jgi:hypothetical protein
MSAGSEPTTRATRQSCSSVDARKDIHNPKGAHNLRLKRSHKPRVREVAGLIVIGSSPGSEAGPLVQINDPQPPR